MRLSLVVICAAFAVGCAHAPVKAAAPAPRVVAVATPAPVENEWHRNIRVVAHRPAGYVFVGRVRGSAPDGDFVAAAKQARSQLSARAEKLGADLIKIESVEPSSPSHRVVIAGRAYRLAD